MQQSADYERGRLYGEWVALRQSWDIIEHSERKSEMFRKLIPLIEKSTADSRAEREAYQRFLDLCQAEVDRFRTEEIIRQYGVIRQAGEV